MMIQELFIKLRICIFFILIALAAESKRPKYREDYRYEQAFGAFYKLHSSAVNWHEAHRRCGAERTELFVPGHLDEADSIRLLIAPILTKYEGVYVGIHDLYSERTFVTVKGSSIKATILELLWEQKQPMNNAGRCVAMRHNGKLFVNPCSKDLPFVCKIKVPKIAVYSTECDTYDTRWQLGPNGTCYLVHLERQTWHEAYSSCYSAGGHLAILNSRAEADYIRELFKQIDQHHTPGDFAFLGYNDLFQRYHYRSIRGERLPEKELSWDVKRACNVTTIEERCGGVRRTGLLATGSCDIPSMFFCEKSTTGRFKN